MDFFLSKVTNLCWDEEKESEIKDLSSEKDNYTDTAMQKIVEKHGKLLTKVSYLTFFWCGGTVTKRSHADCSKLISKLVLCFRHLFSMNPFSLTEKTRNCLKQKKDWQSAAMKWKNELITDLHTTITTLIRVACK